MTPSAISVQRVEVISLDRTPERFAKFERSNPNLPIVRFPAVDGQTLDRWDCVDEGLITPGNPYNLAQLGAALSHIRLWQECANGSEAIHIAEDDAIFRRDFVAQAGAMLSSLDDWDIVLWGWNFDWPLEVDLGPGLGSAVVTCDETRLRALWQDFPAAVSRSVPFRLRSNSGTCAYSVSPRGAQRMLEACLPIAGQPAPYPGSSVKVWANRTLDVEMSRHYAALKAFISVPCLAVSLNVKAEPTI